MTVEFRLLGDIEARVDGRVVEVGHVRQWCVLAALLLDANRAVPVDQLVERVWGDRPPQRARGTLYSYLSRLRRVLGTAGASGAGGARIGKQPGGYLLSVDPEAVDVHRFHRLIASARASADGDVAAALFQRALGLWRGDAFAALDTPWLGSVRVGLDRARLAAELDRNDLDLRRGRHAELLGELCAAAEARPLDERLAGQLMLALYRDGRQGDALACYREMRARLVDELGTDPGPALRELHRRILTADPALAVPLPDSPRDSATVPSPVPRQVPAAPRTFTGRTAELAGLSAAVEAPADGGDTVTVLVIVGTGGIGKTWLAVRWAHENRRRFPAGQLYVDLRGFDPAGAPVPPAVAVRAFLDALGVAPEAIPAEPAAQAALYRSLVADRHLLIVLDNARDSAQVVPLLPGTAACTVLVTSRHQLTGLLTAHGARPLVLDVLSEPEARQLLAGHLGARRVAAEPGPVTALLRRCAGLPLALGIVAARAAVHPGLPLAALAAELDETATRLDALDAGELAVNLRAVLSCSYESLAPEAAHLFGLLGLAPGPDIGLAAAASLAGLPVTATRVLLRQLTAGHLVHEHPAGRYRMHDLVRLYAAEQANVRGTADDRHTALGRVLDHYLHAAHAADRLLSPHRDAIALAPSREGVTVEQIVDHRHALAWFSAEHQVMLAAVDHAARAGFDTHSWQLAWALATFFDARGHWHDRAATHAAALSASQRLADRPAQAYAHRGLAHAHIWLGRYEDAGVHLQRALALFGELGDLAGQAGIHRSLARVFARQGQPRQALPHDERALDLYRLAGHRNGQAIALNAVGWHHAHLGDHERALDYCEQALALHEETGDRHGVAATLDSLGYVHRHLGHPQQATACYERAIDLFRHLGHRYEEAVTLINLGDTHHADGGADRAGDAWRQAAAILDDLDQLAAGRLRARLPRDEHPAAAA